MAFKYDFSKIKENEFALLEPGWYPFRIIEAEELISKKGHPMVRVVASCIDPQHRDKTIWHWIVFLPEDSKGAGMSKHFVKSIGEPFEKTDIVDPDNWVGKTFMGKVEISEYEGKKNNKFAEISPIKDNSGPKEEDPFGD